MAEDLLYSVIVSLPLLVKSIIALFIVVDPLGSIPIFIGLTDKMNKQEQKKTFNTAAIVGFILLLAFTLAGQQILNLFDVSIDSFMVAGGILLLIIAIRLLIAGGWQELSSTPETVGAVPIGCPLLVGPGAITTTMLNMQTTGMIITVVAVIVTFTIVWLILNFIDPIYRVLGKTGALVITRLMALFIAAIAVQYVLEGIQHFIR